MSDPAHSVTFEVEELLTAALRGESAPWPEGPAGTVETRVVEQARAHGVEALLADAMHRGTAGAEWPAGLRTALAASARREALAEPLRYLELKRVLAGLLEAGLQPLVLKGTHLAYTHYPHPHLRPCSDLDLLIRPDDRQVAKRVIAELGYRPGRYTTGELVTHQFHRERETSSGVRYELDVHWRIAEPQRFAHLLSFDELAREAVPIPALGAGARGLSSVSALLFACVHRVAHHHNSRRLIWIYDIHLLSDSLDDAGFERLVRLASAKKVTAVCASGLRLAQRSFGTAVPASVSVGLSAGGGSPDAEPTAAFLTSGRRKVDLLMDDLRALPDWRSRRRLLREHLFPPATFMVEAGHPPSVPRLTVLYAGRIVRGAARWFRRVGR